MAETIFTKIIKGEIPCHKIYEDDKCLAFLDINPINHGHTLVIPKQQVDHLWDTDGKLYLHLMTVARKIAERQRAIIKPKRVGVIVEGFAVPHAHIHVFPMDERLEETMQHRLGKVDDAELTEMAKKLNF